MLETADVRENRDIIKNQQVSNGTTNPAKWVSCARYMGQLSHMLPSAKVSCIAQKTKVGLGLTLSNH